MIVILLSWLYILFTTHNFGLVLKKMLNIQSTNFILNAIFGLFAISLSATLWAFFARLNIEFHCFMLLFNLLTYCLFQKELKTSSCVFYEEMKNLNQNLKISLSIILVLILAQCATAPFLADNESYIIQTIKWLNEYGLVKGLVNLHLFLGQTSGWHIGQSALNFSFLNQNFNDLSGFCLLLVTVFAFKKLDLYIKNNNTNDLIIGLVALFNLFFFMFISSPSSDIPVYIFSFVVFYYFLKNFKNCDSEKFKIITTLVLFILFIKTTTVVVILIPIILFIFNFKALKKTILSVSILSLFTLTLYVFKNIILTAYPFYQFSYLGLNDLDCALPEKILFFLTTSTQADAYWLSAFLYNQMTLFQLIKIWLTATIIDSFFNFLTIVVVVLSPIFIYKFKNQKTLWIIYSITIIQLIIMFLTSLQYRYFIHFVLIFILIFLSLYVKSKKNIILLLTISNISIAYVLFIPINLLTFSKNLMLLKRFTFKLRNLIYPEPNSNSRTKYVVFEKENLKYHSPTENTFFWGTHNAKLPALNKLQFDYFEKYYQIIPQ